jgi:hypothetical protein
MDRSRSSVHPPPRSILKLNFASGKHAKKNSRGFQLAFQVFPSTRANDWSLSCNYVAWITIVRPAKPITRPFYITFDGSHRFVSRGPAERHSLSTIHLSAHAFLRPPQIKVASRPGLRICPPRAHFGCSGGFNLPPQYAHAQHVAQYKLLSVLFSLRPPWSASMEHVAYINSCHTFGLPRGLTRVGASDPLGTLCAFGDFNADAPLFLPHPRRPGHVPRR